MATLADQLNSDDLTLEEKLEAIDYAIKNSQITQSDAGGIAVPVDPSMLTICDGCE